MSSDQRPASGVVGQAAPADPRADRPPLVRPVDSRVIAGVASGLAAHLGLRVSVVRIALVLMIPASGAGLVAYVFLWGFVPEAATVPGQIPPDAGVRGRGDRAGPGQPPAAPSARRRAGLIIVLGLLVVVGGLAFGQGARIDTRFWLPLVLLSVGAAFVWSQLDTSARRSWMPDDPTRRGWAVARVMAGIALAVVGLVLLVTRGRGLAELWDVVVAVLVVLLGVGFIMTPYAARFWADLRSEQTARIRATERADIAAHLHDSVLQTLTLIQRRSDDPQVTRLARGQERELRQWLFAGHDEVEATLASAAAEVSHEVEDRHGIPIDLVVAGNYPLRPNTSALVAALREALVNAATHGGAPISAYVEVGQRHIEAFVRDRGAGFDPDAVPADRQGVRESIIGRMERYGGSARVRALDMGTEVQLSLPIEPLPIESMTSGAEPQTRASGPSEANS